MGVVTGVAAVANLGYNIYSSEKNAKRSRNEYREQRAETAKQNEKADIAQKKADLQLKESKKKLAIGTARSNARRSAGALFQQQESANQPSGTTLG